MLELLRCELRRRDDELDCVRLNLGVRLDVVRDSELEVGVDGLLDVLVRAVVETEEDRRERVRGEEGEPGSRRDTAQLRLEWVILCNRQRTLSESDAR